jgi:hypothetical protein
MNENKIEKKYNPKQRKIFSIPLNPYLTKEDYENIFVPFLKRNKEWIYDVYFTCRIPPFMQDAMGANFTDEAIIQIFNNAMALQKDTGIMVSATFNNVLVPPTYENLEIFVENLKYLYEAGLRSMTIPHNHWVSMGILQKEFPEMLIKNTVLKRVKNGQEFWDACEAGYDYVNIDRILLRDEERLKQIKKAQLKYEEKTGKYVPIAILANEGCRGKCPVMNEHYTINNSSGSRQPGTDKPYFYQKISEVSCPKWRLEDPAYPLKVANIPPYREDVERILSYVDILKMHGREGFGLLNDTVEFVESYVRGDEELFDISVRNLIEDMEVDKTKLDIWRKHIRTCEFECWDCHLCDELIQSAKQKKEDKTNSSIDDLIKKLNEK